MMFTYLITGDINLDHSVQVVTDGFLHGKVTIFSFVINTFIRGDTV